jgi:hypothetical protein
MNLEDDLKRALRPQAPDPGLAGRVLARALATGQPRKRPVWWRAAAASVALATLLGGYTTWRVVEHRRGERAKEQLLQAMRIASEKVSYAQQEVRGIGSNH